MIRTKYKGFYISRDGSKFKEVKPKQLPKINILYLPSYLYYKNKMKNILKFWKFPIIERNNMLITSFLKS